MEAVVSLLAGLPLQPEEGDGVELMEAKSQLFLKWEHAIICLRLTFHAYKMFWYGSTLTLYLTIYLLNYLFSIYLLKEVKKAIDYSIDVSRELKQGAS